MSLCVPLRPLRSKKQLLCPSIGLLIHLIAFSLPACAQSTIRFAETASRAGLNFITENSPTPNKNQIETMITGVGLIDYDQDGLLDIYCINGAAIPSLRKESEKYYNRLYRHNGDGSFTDVTLKAGVAGAGYGMGVAVGDYDNDGWPDLFLASVTANQLFHNNHDGTFTDMTQKADVAGVSYKGIKMWAVAAGWFDYNNDGWLDLFVSNYCRWRVNEDPPCQAGGQRFYCNPNLYEPLHNTLYRNNGDGTFSDVSQETGIATCFGRGMGVAFADLNFDGFIDVFVANDKSPNFLFRNGEGKHFEEVATQAGLAYGENGYTLSGMGVDVRDVNNDGTPDVFHTAIEMETFPLYLNLRNLPFQDVTASSGLAHLTAQMSGWSCGIMDFDNDGWKDLFVARSNVLDNVTLAQPSRKYWEPNALFRNLGNGRFEDSSLQAGPDFQQEAAHRGVAFGDLDNDGRLDCVVTVLGGNLKLFHNVSSNPNHWILLKLIGMKSNRMGIGAQIRVVTAEGMVQYNHCTTSVGYGCTSDCRVHFGLGRNSAAQEIEIRWTSGTEQILKNVKADQILTVQEP